MNESNNPAAVSNNNTDTLWSFSGVELIPTTDELTLLFDPHTGKRVSNFIIEIDTFQV